MARSVKKGPYVPYHLQEKLDKMNASGKKKPIKTWARGAMVTLDFIGHTFLVHDGRKFVPVYTDEKCLGRYLGEFVATRRFGGHSSKKKK